MKSLVHQNQNILAPPYKNDAPIVTIQPEYVRITPLREEKLTITWPQFVSGIFFFVMIGMAMMASLSTKISGWRPIFFILGLGIGYAGRILYQHYKQIN